MSLTVFAQRMKQAREAKSLKQNELAKAVGVTPTTISAYEKSDDEGNGKKPTLENAQAIAEKLEVSLDWLCGMSDNVSTSYTDFTAKEYFKSLITVLMETSSVFDDTLQNGIVLQNPDILRFAKKISDLINVYRAGSIPDDLFDVCVEKIINDFNDYTAIGNCVLENSEADDAEQILFDSLYGAEIFKGSDTPSAGTLTFSVSENRALNNARKIKIVISHKMVNEANSFNNSKGGSDNGNDNPQKE